VATIIRSIKDIRKFRADMREKLTVIQSVLESQGFKGFCQDELEELHSAIEHLKEYLK